MEEVLCHNSDLNTFTLSGPFVSLYYSLQFSNCKMNLQQNNIEINYFYFKIWKKYSLTI